MHLIPEGKKTLANTNLFRWNITSFSLEHERNRNTVLLAVSYRYMFTINSPAIYFLKQYTSPHNSSKLTKL